MEKIEAKEKEPLKHVDEVDDKGVPLANRFKEFERKMEDKYAKELEQTRLELQELKSSMPQPKTTAHIEEESAKVDLMEFVKNPKGFVQTAWQQAEFQRQLPVAEAWLKEQKSYVEDDEARIAQIIQENKLNTPYHAPMDRARTAWKILEAEKREKVLSSENDETRREAAAAKAAGEGIGKSTPKQSPTTRADILRKLADAELKGDMEASIKYTNMLEDIR